MDLESDEFVNVEINGGDSGQVHEAYSLEVTHR